MTTPDPLTRAAAKLRRSADLLHRYERYMPWHNEGSGVRVGGMLVADCGHNEDGQRAAEHIALTASPDVTEATEALLLAAAKARRSELDDDVYRTLRALAAAIERQET